MNSMFYAYDNDINFELDTCLCATEAQLDKKADVTRMLYTKTGKFIGVQVRYKMPFSLYFNLRETQGRQDLVDFVANSTIVFKVNNTNHKTILEKAFAGFEIFNPITNDLCITLTQQDVLKLQQESYRVELDLINDEDLYPLFNELDAYLVIR